MDEEELRRVEMAAVARVTARLIQNELLVHTRGPQRLPEPLADEVREEAEAALTALAKIRDSLEAAPVLGH